MPAGPDRSAPICTEPACDRPAAGAVGDHVCRQCADHCQIAAYRRAQIPPTPAELADALAAVDRLELRRAARLVLVCWGDGDEVDPDRMDVVIDRLTAALAAVESRSP